MNAGVRVLVADDNELDRLVLSTIVRKEGYDVEEAVDGFDALARFEAQRPQLVLLDALMPGMDGFEAARRMKAGAGDDFIPIIFLTSLTEADELARCLDAGGDDFLSKPYNKVILKAKLAALERMRNLHLTLQRQRDEIARHNAHFLQEQEAAKAVFDNVAHTGYLDAPFIRYHISPLAVFNGDVLLAARNPSGDLYMLLGDFTGHGLTAAIGALPLAEVFYGMANKGFVIREILKEANRKLRGILPQGYFCCATLVALNFRKQTVEFWNGGLPPGVLFKRMSKDLVHLDSEHLPLGILSDDQFDDETRILELGVGDKLLLWTDGVVEARDQSGAVFGYDRLDEVVRSTPADDCPFDRAKAFIYQHMASGDRDDDITLAEITMVEAGSDDLKLTEEVVEHAPGSEDWNLVYELGPRSLKGSNPLALLQHVVMEVPQLRAHSGAIYTILTELYSNALEHGLMGLDSSLKSSAEGFARYYQNRARALDALNGNVRFELTCRIGEEGGNLDIRVVDSGSGFDYATQLNGGAAVEAYHGRGMKLLKSLCQTLVYKGKGNEVEVSFSWRNDDE